MQLLKKINKKLLLGFIAPYLVTVIVVFMAQYILNTVVLNALKNNVVEVVHNSFESSVGVIEQNLLKVKETAALVSQNTSIKLEEFDKKDIEDVYSAIDELSSYSLGSGVIHDICVQNDEKDYLINFWVFPRFCVNSKMII